MLKKLISLFFPKSLQNFKFYPVLLKMKTLIFKYFLRAYFPLKGFSHEGYRVFYSKLIDLEPSHFVYNDVMKIYNMILDLWIFTEGTMKGHIILMDMEGCLISHAGRMSPLGIKKYLYYLQEALPVRLKGLHFMNSVPVMDIILGMMKPFMKKELMDIVSLSITI